MQEFEVQSEFLQDQFTRKTGKDEMKISRI